MTADRETRAETAAQRRERLDLSVRGALADARLAGLDRPSVERLCRGLVEEIWPAAPEGGV